MFDFFSTEVHKVIFSGRSRVGEINPYSINVEMDVKTGDIIIGKKFDDISLPNIIRISTDEWEQICSNLPKFGL